MSIDGGLDDHEESVRIAVKALDDMRNSTNIARPSAHNTADSEAPNSPAFVERMSHIPFVNSALRVYEQGKASSRVVKYGAEMVESSVKTISRPVINRLPVDVNQLDEFACRQLDRLDRYRHPSGSENQGLLSTSPDILNQDRERGRPKSKTKKTLDGSALEDDNDHDESSSSRHHWGDGSEANTPYINSPPLPPPDSRSSTPTQIGDESRPTSVSRNLGDDDETRVAQRSRWQAVLLEAGGLSAALSEESMQRLKYCLHWLQYATAYIDAHILFLRNFTVDLQPLPSDAAAAESTTTPRPPISEEHMRRLIDVKRDIVHTIRQAVDIVSKYAGGALPEPARTRVRGFILTLPQRWASRAGGTGGAAAAASSAGGGVISTAGIINNNERDSTTVTAAASGTGATRRPGGGQRRAAYRERGTGGGVEGDLRSGASSRATSPSMSPRIPRTKRGSGGGGGGEVGESGENGRVPAGTALVAAQRILALATESLDMMRNVTGVMKDSLDRAEAWVGRLRTVGIQRDTQVEGGTDTSELEQDHHDRSIGGSTTQFDEAADHDILPPNSPYFSASSTVWSSTSVPSTPVRGTFTPVYAAGGGGGGGGTVSPGGMMMIPIGAMSLSSRYETPRGGVLSLADEEEEEGERDGLPVMVEDKKNLNRKINEDVRVIGEEEEEEEEKGVKMDVDVDLDVRG